MLHLQISKLKIVFKYRFLIYRLTPPINKLSSRANIIKQMFPNNYSFNPGMVLDPVTMTPMLAGSGNITVNPLGVPMRPENKVWQKMFIKNIPQECSNDNMIKLLNQFGHVKSFKRPSDSRGRLMGFCHFELETGEEIIRIKRLFHHIKILDKQIELTISPETENFIKEWTSIQKDEWRKKLQAPGMNEAKQYDTIESYFIREDKQLRAKIEDTLRQINSEVRVIARERQREDERKEHPREKERDRKKKRMQEELDRTFRQKEDYWLKRERQKDREYRKQKDREREREKATRRRLEKELDLDPVEEQRRAEKYTSSENRKMVALEEQQDTQVIEEENPPLPQETDIGKRAVLTEESVKLGGHSEVKGGVSVGLPEIEKQETQQKHLGKNERFKDWEQVEAEPQKQDLKVELHLPQVEQVAVQDEKAMQKQLEQIQQMVPQNKSDLFNFKINWDKLSKSVVLERNIRPWLEKRSDEYIGGVEEKFIALVEKKLLSRSHPDKIIKILRNLLDDDSEEFVVKLWKKLILEYLKLQRGIE